MTWASRIGLALALVATGGVSAADPATPQLNPLHRQREDAKRLTEHQRGLETAVRAPAAAALSSPLVTPSSTRHTTRGTGMVLLGIAGASAIIAVPLLIAGSVQGDSDGSGAQPVDTLSKVFVATSLIAGFGGVLFLATDRTVQVSPTVSPRAVGVAITGRL
jgi:hypothetical protein